jgi:hypothetical protein
MNTETAIKEINSRIELANKDYPDLVKEYLEVLKMAVEALRKQEPVKPEAVEDKIWCCPSCWNNLMQIWSEYPTKKMEFNRGLPYCLGCGQAIDWEE